MRKVGILGVGGNHSSIYYQGKAIVAILTKGDIYWNPLRSSEKKLEDSFKVGWAAASRPEVMPWEEFVCTLSSLLLGMI